jgi:hypothetical protein
MQATRARRGDKANEEIVEMLVSKEKEERKVIKEKKETKATKEPAFLVEMVKMALQREG